MRLYLGLALATMLVGCGRVDFTAQPTVKDGLTVDADLSGVTGEIGVGSADRSSGRAAQTHLIYARNSAQWWLFYNDDVANILRAAYSSDLVTWTPSTVATLSISPLLGTNIGVAYADIDGVDVVHVALAYMAATERHDHLRATVSPSAIAWGTEAQVACTGDSVSTTAVEDGPVVVIDADHRIYDFSSAWLDDATCNLPDLSTGNFDVTYSKNPDLGATWTSGWNSPPMLKYASYQLTGHWGAAMATGVVTVQTDGQSETTDNAFDNLWWSSWNGTAWSTVADVFAADLATKLSSNDWGAVQVSASDSRLVIRNDASSYTWYRFDGTTWSVGQPAIPDQPSAAASGPFLASDGGNVWLFVIDSDADNTIRYVKFDGATWGSWTAFESSAQTRSFLSGTSGALAGTIALEWTEARGSGFAVVTTPFSTR